MNARGREAGTMIMSTDLTRTQQLPVNACVRRARDRSSIVSYRGKLAMVTSLELSILLSTICIAVVMFAL